MAKAKAKAKPKPKIAEKKIEPTDDRITWDTIGQRLISFCNAPENQSYRWYPIESIRDITIYRRHTSTRIAVFYKPIDKKSGHISISDPQFNAIASAMDEKLAEWLKKNG